MGHPAEPTEQGCVLQGRAQQQHCVLQVWEREDRAHDVGGPLGISHGCDRHEFVSSSVRIELRKYSVQGS